MAGFYTNLGYAYFAQKKMPQAFAAFQKAMAINPDVFQQNDRNGAVMSYQSVADRGLFDFMLAKSYAQKADAMNCAVYLRKAHDEGYKATEKDLADKAFDMVRADPDVKSELDLLQPPQKSASSAPPAPDRRTRSSLAVRVPIEPNRQPRAAAPPSRSVTMTSEMQQHSLFTGVPSSSLRWAKFLSGSRDDLPN